jgi:Tol biopolymer transport system component
MRPATLAVLLAAGAMVVLLAGCGGTGAGLFQTVSERATWSSQHVIAFAALGGNAQLYIWRSDESGGGQTLLTASSGNPDPTNEGGWEPAFSPDGVFVAFVGQRGGSQGIYRMSSSNGDSAGVTLLTDSTNPGQDIEPNYSHSGTKIIYASNKVIGGGTGNLNIVIQNSDGTGSRNYVVATTSNSRWPCFSPDDTFIAYNVGPDTGPTDIYTLNLSGGAPVNITAALRTGPGDMTRFEAPWWATVAGQAWIYFHSNRNGGFNIWRMSPTGTDLQQITSDQRSDGYPVINPAATQLLWTRNRELWTRAPVPGAVTETRIVQRYQ